MRCWNPVRCSGRTLGLAAGVLFLVALFPLALAAQTPEEISTARAVAEGEAAAGGAIKWALGRQVDRDRYKVGPGDRLLLILEGKNLRRLRLTVLPEGVLEWEGGLHEQITGLSLAETQARVAEILSPLMPEVEVTLHLLEPRRIEVHVLGEVKDPGAVELWASDCLSTALRAAGGPSLLGSRRFVEFRDGAVCTRLDLYPFLLTGDWDANPYCPSNVVIFVPQRMDTVRVIGEVNRPGTYEWKEGETLADFLDYARGFTQDALPGSILLERDEREVVTVLLDSGDGDMVLRPSDTIVVGSRKPMMNRVFLEGAGERLGEIYLSPGETLGDLVHRLGETRGRAMPDQAVLERKATDRDRFLRFDLREVLRGEGPAELPIQHDDVLYVPRRSSEVFVLGEVRKPGPLSYAPSRTVGQYLAMAGGTSDQGSTRRLHVVDASGILREVRTTDNLHRGDVIVVGRSMFSVFSELLLTAASLSGVILAINALAK